MTNKTTLDKTLWSGLGRTHGLSGRKDLYAKLLGFGCWGEFLDHMDRLAEMNADSCARNRPPVRFNGVSCRCVAQGTESVSTARF